MDEKGVYAIARTLWTSGAFMNQKFTQREAWMWLIGAAVWKQTRVHLDGKSVILERGEFAFAVRFLAIKWKWSKSTVARFLIMLEKEDMIRDTKRDGHAVFSINKYNDFQVVGLPKQDAERDAIRDDVGTSVGQTRDKEETLQALEEKKTISLTAVRSSKPPSGDFDQFWVQCPRKRAKGRAKKAYAKAILKTSPATLAAAMARYAASRVGEPEAYTKHPATWLSDECWTDEVGGTGPPSLRIVVSGEVEAQEQENLRKLGVI